MHHIIFARNNLGCYLQYKEDEADKDQDQRAIMAVWLTNNFQALSLSPMMSGPGFFSMSPESRINSINAFITNCREVMATRYSNENWRTET